MVPAMKQSAIRKHAETVAAPLLTAGLYAALILSSGAGGPSQAIAALFFVVVLGLWIAFRRLRVHAAASRLVAIGRPDEVAKLVEREVPRRWTSATKAPLHVFAAMGHNLAGEHEQARQALVTSGIKLGGKDLKGWQVLAAAADIHARTAMGDVKGAKESYARGIATAAMMPGSGIVALLASEAEARIALADGDPARARELVAPMAKDIRLGPAARAQVHAIMAQALAAEGDAEGAQAQAAKARALAPKCVFRGLP